MLMTYSQCMEPGAAFAQLGLIKVRETSLPDVLRRVVDLAAWSVPGVAEASVTMVRGLTASTPACTGDLAAALDQSQYTLGHGPCLQAAATTTVESIGDMATESRWPDWTAGALRAGARSSLSIGLPAHAAVNAALNLYATEPAAFDVDAVVVAQAFAGFAGLAMTNDYLNDAQAAFSRYGEAVMDAEALLEQAKGVIIGERHCTAEEAFDVLTAMAQDTDRTVRAVARSLVKHTIRR
jgi:ANTAR domain/GAF domain